jgi:hypothetical protein
MYDNLYRCKYATEGCAHVRTCDKQHYKFAIQKCGYFAYFKYLDEHFGKETLQTAEEVL